MINAGIKKKLLLAGGGYADIPLIESAKKLGYHVITSGNNPNDLGHRYANDFFLEDFSDLEAMLRLSEKLRIDAICACCNDFSALSASYVAEKLGLPGHDSYKTTRLLHHKDMFRRFSKEIGIPSPWAMGFKSFTEAAEQINRLAFPVIIKPVDLTGGKGISIANNPDEALKAIRDAFSISRSKRIVIEEYLSGSRHGLSAFLVNGKVAFHFSDDEYYYRNNYLVSAASTPGTPGADVVSQVCSYAETISDSLKLKDGIFHIQYVLQPNGNAVIIEVCRRAPGDLYIRFVQLATGLDYPVCIVKAAAGLDCSDIVHREPDGFYTRHCVMANRNGVLKDIYIDATVRENIIEKFIWSNTEEIVDRFLVQKFGIVFLKFGSFEEMKDKTSQMQLMIEARLK